MFNGEQLRFPYQSTCVLQHAGVLLLTNG